MLFSKAPLIESHPESVFHSLKNFQLDIILFPPLPIPAYEGIGYEGRSLEEDIWYFHLFQGCISYFKNRQGVWGQLDCFDGVLKLFHNCSYYRTDGQMDTDIITFSRKPYPLYPSETSDYCLIDLNFYALLKNPSLPRNCN